MISSPTAAASYTASAALDRATAPSGPGASATSSDQGAPDASPDVVVTLGAGRPAASSTYDATGRLPGGASLDELGANGPTSLATATEAIAARDDGNGVNAPDSAPTPEDAVPA